MFKTSLASLGLGLTALLANPAPALAAGAEIHFNPSFESVAVGQVFNALLVDGVPAGGAFVPALASLDLTNVERIEVMKGAAPVSYGATAFVGVIHVIHYAAGEGPSRVGFGYGSRGSLRAEFAAPLSSHGGWKDTLVANAEHQELAADRAGYDRGHLLYRAEVDAEDFAHDIGVGGRWHWGF